MLLIPNRIYFNTVHLPLLVLVFFFPGILSGQTDYKEAELKLPSMLDDTTKVNMLLKLGEYYCSSENDKAIMYLQEAYTISLDLGYSKGIGNSLLWMGRVYYYESKFNLSNKYLDKAKKVLEKTDDPEALSFCFFAKAATLKVTGDYAHAIEMYKKSIALSTKTGNYKRLTNSYLGMGSILLDRKDNKKALSYFNEALTASKKLKNKMGVDNVYSSLAFYYNSTGMPDSALFYFKKALKIRTDLNMNRRVAASEMSIGKTLIELKRYDEAERSLNHALQIFKKLNEQTGIIFTNLSLANAIIRQGNPEGFTLADKTLKMAIKIDNPNLLSFVYGRLSDIYAYSDNYQKAYEYQKIHEKLKDSLFTSEKDRMLAEVEAKFRTEQKDRDITLLKERARVEKNKNILLIVLLVVFLVVIILLFLMFRYKSTAFKRQQKLLKQEKIIHTQENKLAEKEKQLLQEQLESKNRELASKALEMIRMNETISEIIEKLEKFNSQTETNPAMVRSIKEIIHDLETHTKQNIWNEFDKIFKNIHSGFYARLLDVCPDLTSTEIKTAALLKLNLTTKEIAAITFKSEGGIKTTRYRLRKKLGLSGDDKLVPYLMQI